MPNHYLSALIGGIVSDQYAQNVKLQLSLNGPNAYTLITDEAGHPITLGGLAQITTAQGEFSDSSLFCVQPSYLKLAGSEDFNLYGGDFTVELSIFPTEVQGTRFLMGTANAWFAAGDIAPGEAGWGLRMETTGLTILSRYGTIESVNATWIIGAWNQIEWCQKNGVNSFIVNGDLVKQGPFAGNGLGNDPVNSLYIGATPDHFAGTAFVGYMDNIRLTKGVARHEASHPKNIAQFPPLS